MTTGERIRILRMDKGLSQEGLADALDVTRQAVSRWETDASLPDIDKLIGLCDLFGVSLDYLVRGKEPDPAAEVPEQEPADTPAQTSSAPIRRSAIAGILCIALGISASPQLIFAFAPFFSLRYLFLAMIPVVLLLTGVLLLLRRLPSVLHICWGLLLTGALGYTYRNAAVLSNLIRGLMARYPELMYRDWEECRRQMLLWPWIALLILGMLCWTVLYYRKTGLKHRSRRRFFLSLGLFAGSVLLLAVLVLWLFPAVFLNRVVRMGILYLLFWLAVLSLTYCLVWLLSSQKTDDNSVDFSETE